MIRKTVILMWLVLACTLAVASTLHAQQAPSTSGLSLAQCLEIARTNQTDIIISSNNVDIAKQNLTREKSAYLPHVVLQNNTFTIGDKGVLSRSSTGTALSVEQNIYDGGLREARVDSARYGVLQRSYASDRTVQAVVYTVTRSYYDVLRYKSLAEVAIATVTYNQELKSQIETRASLGDAAAVEVLPVESQLAGARVDLLIARRNVKSALIALQTNMGQSPQLGFDIQGLPDSPIVELESTSALLETALALRPDIRQAQAQISSTAASVRTAEIYTHPRPVITGSYSKSISGGFSSTGGQIVGGIVFDVFNGGANRAAVEEARLSRANAQEQLTELIRQVHAQVEDAVISVNDAKDRIGAAQASLESSRKNMEVQKERYNQGLGITLDLLNAEAQLISAQSSLVQAQYDYYSSLSQLEYAIGRQGV